MEELWELALGSYLIAALFILCGVACVLQYPRENSANSGRSYNPVINRRSTIERLQTSTELAELRRPPERIRQYLDSLGLQWSERQRMLRNTPSFNSTGLLEPRSVEDNNYSVSRLTNAVNQQTAISPPAYNDVTQQRLVTITMEQQSSSLPSYDEFMQGIHQRDDIDG